MALSASTNFSLNGDQIITEAFELLAVHQNGVPIDPDQMVSARRKLNLVLKTLQNKGFILQTRKKLSITLAAQSSYSIALSGADVTNNVPIKVIQAVLKHNTTLDEIFLTEVNHEQYYSFLARDNTGNTGQPAQYYFDRTTYNKVTLFLDKKPDASTITNYKVDLWYTKPIDDVDISTDDIEIPVEGYEAVIWALAARLALPHGVPASEAEYLRKRAEQIYQDWIGLDREDSLHIHPDMSIYSRRC